MRVLIELLDKEPLKNVLAPCVFKPEIVVYLCNVRDTTFFKESAIIRLFKRRKMKTLPRFYYFDATDPVYIRRVLQAVVRDYPGCVFDFTGGGDLVLLVAGACFAEMQLPGFYIDIRTRRFLNIRGCDKAAGTFEMPLFDADDVFAMTGATIQGHGHFPPTGISEEFEKDSIAVFDVVKCNPKAWGEFVSWLQRFCSGTPGNVPTVEGLRRQKNGKGSAHGNEAVLANLADIGVLTWRTLSRHHMEISFKSPLYRKCLLIEGIWLELFAYTVARQSGVFDDVRTSIVVDWAGVDGGSDNAKNEVDVFLVKDVMPIFVSCKMSVPGAFALNEIKLLAQKFGGNYARPVLLTAARFGDEHKVLRTRAAEMGVTLLDRTATEGDRLVEHLSGIVAPRPVPEPLPAVAMMNLELE